MPDTPKNGERLDAKTYFKLLEDEDEGRNVTRLYRFQDWIAGNLGRGPMFYLDPATARGIAKALIEGELKTDPVEIDESRWEDMHECLPPSRAGTVGGAYCFHMSERLRNRLCDWFIQTGRGEARRFFTFCENDNITNAELAAKVAAALALEPGRQGNE